MTSDGRRRLIVNADDLGRTPGINEGIFEAHRSGVVSSATLMVNATAARAAATQAGKHPQLGVGLHLALTGGRPSLSPECVPSLVDGRGLLPRHIDGLEGADGTQVLAEARAQVERFEEFMGRPPTHIDTHHHAHTLPVVFDALVTVAREIGCPVRSVSGQMRTRLAALGLATTDSFIDAFFGDQARLNVLLHILEGVGPGVTELMCHPAVVDDELRQNSSYADDRDRERDVLTDAAAREALAGHRIELIHFGSLCAS